VTKGESVEKINAFVWKVFAQTKNFQVVATEQAVTIPIPEALSKP
jgi:hypothetical protein